MKGSSVTYSVWVWLWGVSLMLAGPMDLSAAETGVDTAPGRTMAVQATKSYEQWTTSDHSKHAALKQAFTSGAQITEACLSCHSEAETQFHKTIHWTWDAGKNAKGVEMGKGQYSVNNFCISTNKGADKSCFSCHPSWNGERKVVNCLVCHGQKEVKWDEAFEDLNALKDQTDEGSKEIYAEILSQVQTAAQSIGRPTRKNCGTCHFYGGGGDGVKHGDLDSSMAMPNKALDVHMGTDGRNFECVRCHTTIQHQVAGRIYTAPAATERKSLIQDDLAPKITCESCHSATPHKPGHKANDHTDKVACQSCHIPTFARVNPTKMMWDWSQAGKLKDGKPYKEEDELGKDSYLSIKGAMRWEKHVKPEYFWFNGSIQSVTAKDVIDPGLTVAMSHPLGDREDPKSRIFPFKVHRGKQPYDKINKTVVGPLLSTEHGFWTTLNWQDAIQRGQNALGIPYSGQYDFISTTYVMPTTHMVAPKENVVSCTECHTRNGGRLASLAGFYMPGRDRLNILDSIGWLVVIGSLAGVCLHGLGRVFANGRNGKNGGNKGA